LTVQKEFAVMSLNVHQRWLNYKSTHASTKDIGLASIKSNPN